MLTTFSFDSHGKTKIKGYHWKTEGEPNHVLVISHGMAEYIMRYDDFANTLLKNGIAVWGHSHRGHYETARTQDQLGYLGQDGWNHMVNDLEQVILMAKSTYPNVPLTLFGHSMGSYVTRDLLINRHHLVDRVILSGTGFPSRPELEAGRLIALIEQKIKKDKPSKLLDKMSFGTFNKAFKPTQTAFDWLSRDAKQVQAYIDSPWCGQLHPSSFFALMSSGLIRALYLEKPQLAKAKPLYVMSGDKDPVGQFGKGVKKTADFYKKQGFEVSLKLYPEGRHEMLNELNNQEVYQDIINYITQKSD